jgi:hypothetical protein
MTEIRKIKDSSLVTTHLIMSYRHLLPTKNSNLIFIFLVPEVRHVITVVGT